MFTARNLTFDPSPPRPSLPILGDGHYIELASLSHQRTGPGGSEFEKIIGAGRGMSSVLDQVRMVAATDSTVLIQGETGTGKELIAEAIHQHSPRRNRPCVTVNCAAIPSGLLESELFGHERGAFTGALVRKLGKFEAAQGGTLFLDEIGDMPIELQPKLLRVLQEHQLERLGSTHAQKIDVRVVAATNQQLPTLIASKQFRSDLYYRLNVFPIAMPALRHRSEDIRLLIRHFVRTHASRMGKTIQWISSEALVALEQHDWPGNIRELQNVIERAVILTTDTVLAIPLDALWETDFQVVSPPRTLAAAERAHVVEALNQTEWVVGGAKGAAVRLGVARTTLISLIRRLNIKRSHDGNSDHTFLARRDERNYHSAAAV
jgi:transcriptional regulator with GAF, ATPase, and Fis domain